MMLKLFHCLYDVIIYIDVMRWEGGVAKKKWGRGVFTTVDP